jgi:hypothetical protein
MLQSTCIACRQSAASKLHPVCLLSFNVLSFIEGICISQCWVLSPRARLIVRAMKHSLLLCVCWLTITKRAKRKCTKLSIVLFLSIWYVPCQQEVLSSNYDEAHAKTQKISSDKRALKPKDPFAHFSLHWRWLSWREREAGCVRAAAKRARMWTASGRHAHSSLKRENWCQRRLWTVLDFSERGRDGAVHSSHPNQRCYFFLLFSSCSELAWWGFMIREEIIRKRYDTLVRSFEHLRVKILSSIFIPIERFASTVAMSSNISFSCKRHSFAIHGCDLDQGKSKRNFRDWLNSVESRYWHHPPWCPFCIRTESTEVIIMTLLLLNSARSLRASNSKSMYREWDAGFLLNTFRWLTLSYLVQSCLVKESLSVWQFWLLNILDTANDSQGPL